MLLGLATHSWWTFITFNVEIQILLSYKIIVERLPKKHMNCRYMRNHIIGFTLAGVRWRNFFIMEWALEGKRKHHSWVYIIYIIYMMHILIKTLYDEKLQISLWMHMLPYVAQQFISIDIGFLYWFLFVLHVSDCCISSMSSALSVFMFHLLTVLTSISTNIALTFEFRCFIYF